MKKYNLCGSITDLPFKTNQFDFVFETSLCHVGDKQIVKAIGELNRVIRKGLIFGSVTSDLPAALIDKYNLLRGVKKLGTWWEWSELFFTNGFDLSMNRRDVTAGTVGNDDRREQGPRPLVRGRGFAALFVLRQDLRRRLIVHEGLRQATSPWPENARVPPV